MLAGVVPATSSRLPDTLSRSLVRSLGVAPQLLVEFVSNIDHLADVVLHVGGALQQHF
jgi:hypothetical protein